MSDSHDARSAAIAALQNGTTLAEVAAALFDAENTSASEMHWSKGYRAAMTSMLIKVLSDLGYQDTEETRAKWIIEREQAVSALRDICADHGDNDWEDDLHLGDVINKHLHRHLGEGG